MNARYWLRIGDLPWQEATREQFIKAERAAGFYPKVGDGTATAGFGGSGVNGRVTYGEIDAKTHGWDPEFFEVARKSTPINPTPVIT